MDIETRDKRLQLRISTANDAVIRAAAAKRSLSVSQYLVESALARAEMELADRTQYSLDADAWSAFVHDLDHPAVVNKGLADLFDRVPRDDSIAL